MKLGQKEIELLYKFRNHWNINSESGISVITEADVVDFAGRENLRLTAVGGSADIEIAQCDTCKEVTPQLHSTTGGACQVCLNVNPYDIERAFTQPSDSWLANFWEYKYRSHVGIVSGNFVIDVK